MNKEEKNKKTTKAQDDRLDEKIYQAMVERGWVFPQTIEEVEIAEEQMDRETAPPHGELPNAKAILKRMALMNSNESTLERERNRQPPLLLLRQRTQMKATTIAEELKITVTFLSDISSHPNIVPFRSRNEIAKRAAANLPGVKEQEVLDSFEYSSYQPVAAFRDKPFYEEGVSYEKIVQRSDMSEEQQQYWLSLADEE